MDDDIFGVFSLTPLRFIFSIIAIISMAMVFDSGIGLLFRCALIIFILLNLFFLWYKHVFVVCFISHVKDAEWVLLSCGKSLAATICSSSVVNRYISILYFVDASRRKHVVILIGGVFESYYHRRLRFIVRTQ